jgi:putative redox protein
MVGTSSGPGVGGPSVPPSPAGTATRVDLVRTGPLRFQASNARGATLDLGNGDDPGFSPVELLLAAIAGCTGMDVDAITGRRAEAERFEVSAQAEKMRDRDGNHLVNISVSFSVAFGKDESGTAAQAVLEPAIRKSHDRLCIVTRTVELPSPTTK